MVWRIGYANDLHSADGMSPRRRQENEISYREGAKSAKRETDQQFFFAFFAPLR